MSGTQPSEAVREAMNHDVATGSDPALGRFLFILLIRIGKVNRFVEAALRVSAVEYVATLPRFGIPLLFFGADRRTSERHFLSAENLPMGKLRQHALAFPDDHM